jgi:signal transduction histidine kinase
VESVAFPTDIVNALQNAFTNEFYRSQYHLSIENLNSFLIRTPADIEERANQLYTRYNKNTPKAIIIIGTPTWICLRDFFARMWQDVPIILITISDYATDIPTYLQRRPLTNAERIPMVRSVEGFNITLIRHPVFIRETIDLMKLTITRMTELYFISDKRYESVQVRENVKLAAELYFPELRLYCLNEGDMTMEQLMDTIRLQGEEAGFLYYSWSQSNNDQQRNLTSSAYKVISTITSTPLYTLEDVGLDDRFTAGGYFGRNVALGQTVVKTLKEILDDKRASAIEWQMGGDIRFHVSYPVLTSANIRLSALPEGTELIDQPPSFWYLHGVEIAFIASALIIITLIILQRRSLRKEKHVRQEQVDTFKKYKELIGEMPVGYVKMKLYINKSGVITDYTFLDPNPHFENFFDVAERITNKNKKEMPKGILDDCDRSLSAFSVELRYGKPVTFEYYVPNKQIYLLMRMVPTNVQDIWDCFASDVTELRKAQTEMQFLNRQLGITLEVSQIIPMHYDCTAGLFTFMLDPLNQKHLVLEKQRLQMTKEEYLERVWAEDREKAASLLMALIEDRNKTDNNIKQEYRFLSPFFSDKEYRWVETRGIVTTRNEEGKPMQLVGSYLDITAKKKNEMELRLAKSQAEESNRMKSAFIASISHEIRTPLNAIVGFSSMLMESEDAGDKQEYMSLIEHNNQLLLKQIENMINLSDIESEKMTFEFDGFYVGTLLESMYYRFEKQLKETKKPITMFLDSSKEECFIFSDSKRLRDVLANLLSNAIKFTHEGEIHIGYRKTEKHVYVYVSDTGSGVPEEQQAHIFDHFSKIDEFEQGVGVGLAICKRIIHKLGGAIGIESEEGKGSTFWFTLPYSIDVEA